MTPMQSTADLPFRGDRAALWAFRELGATRDPRLEMMRGALMLCLMCATLTQLPALQTLHRSAWEISKPLIEGLFVMTTAMVTGAVFRSTATHHGLPRCVGALLRRTATWYAAVTLVGVVVAFASHLPGVDLAFLTRWTDPATGATGATYPNPSEPIAHQLFELMFLQAGPPQMQLPALCVALLALTPLPVWALLRGRTWLALAASGLLAALWVNSASEAGAQESLVFGMQFERSHPLALWQLPFVTGLAIGWHRQALWPALGVREHGLVALGATFLGAAGACAWQLASIEPGPGATIALTLLVGFPTILLAQAVLSAFWRPLRVGIGALLLPLGQSPLAVWTLIGASLIAFSLLPALSLWAAWAAIFINVLAIWVLVRTPATLRWLPH